MIKNIIKVLIVFIFTINTCNAKINYNALHNNHDIIEKREHGGKSYFAIGKDNYGGYSYGKYQLSTERRNNRPSTFDFFIRYAQDRMPYIAKKLNDAGGQEAAFKGDENFKKVWKKLANQAEFRQVYDEFLLNTQIIPVYDRLDSINNKEFDILTNWSSEDNAIQAAIKSAIIQHGPNGAYGMIVNVIEIYKPKTKLEFIEKLYKYREIRFPKYKKRYTLEYKDLNDYIKSGKSLITL